MSDIVQVVSPPERELPPGPDYDEISVTTENSTKVTADIDNTALALSIGKSF